MVNILTFIGFFIFTCAGMVLLKFGGEPGQYVLFKLPVINFDFTFITFVGFFLYGISFLLYSSLLRKYELSFLNPFTIGITSILIFICAVVFFHETITVVKIMSLLLILSGVLLINFAK